MECIGLYREMSNSISDTVKSIHDDLGLTEKDVAEQVAGYLASGIPVIDFMEATYDPLDKTVVIPGGASLLSDGNWVWRNDMAYLMKKYCLGLPSEFIDHAVKNKKVDHNLEEKILDLFQEVYESYERARK